MSVTDCFGPLGLAVTLLGMAFIARGRHCEEPSLRGVVIASEAKQSLNSALPSKPAQAQTVIALVTNWGQIPIN